MMARRNQPEPTSGSTNRSRTGAAWLSLTLFVLFVVLLIVFIAQNNRKVPLHFLGASGRVSESVALVVAALAGAVIVILVGTARILTLRVAARRARKDLRRHQQAAASEPATNSVPAGPAVGSGAPTTEREAQPVEAENQA